MKRMLLAILLCLPQLGLSFDHVVHHIEYVSADEYESMKQSGFKPDAYTTNPWTVGVPDPAQCHGQDKCIAMALVAAPIIGEIVAVVGIAIIAAVVGIAIKSETQADKDRRGLARGQWSPATASDEEVVYHWMHIAAHRQMLALNLDEGGMFGHLRLMHEEQDPMNMMHLKGDELEDCIYAKEKILLRGNRGNNEDPDPTGFPKLYTPIKNHDGKWGQLNQRTYEIYVKDPSKHGGPHWEVYKNRVAWKNGDRSHKVYEAAGKFQYGKRMTLDNKPLVR